MPIITDLADTINQYIHAPLDVLNTGQDLAKDAGNLPNQIIAAIQQMQIPIMMIGAIILIKQLRE